MAQQKKSTDPTEVALSAIEEALGITPNAPQATTGAAEISPIAKPEDFDIFAEASLAPAPILPLGDDTPSGDDKTGAAKEADKGKDTGKESGKDTGKEAIEPRGANLTGKEITSTQSAGSTNEAAFDFRIPAPVATERPVIPPHLPEAASLGAANDLKQDIGGPETLPVLPILKPRASEAEKPAAEAKEAPRPRASAHPANDDRRANVAALLAPLHKPASGTPLLWAGLASLLWLGCAAAVAMSRDGLLLNAEGALRTDSAGTIGALAVGVLLPILFFFSLAALQRRSRELKTSAQVMAEVAARLAEPEVPGMETVFTLGQAVRREVTSIGDGIERAVARAGELEGLVHGEVSALERSYADNEYKMRQLVSELAAEREAIMATAERIRQSIESAHQGFTVDIDKATRSMTIAVDEAGGRVHSVMGDRQALLVATLETTAAMIGQVIDERSQDLSNRLQSIAMEAASGVENARSDLVAALSRTGSGVVTELSQASGMVSTLLDEQTRAMLSTLSGTANEVTTSFARTAGEIGSALDARSRQMVEALDTTSGELTGAITRTTAELTGVLDERSRTMMDALGTTSSELTGAITRTTAELTGVLDEHSRTVVDAITQTSDRLNGALNETSEKVAATLDSRAQNLAESFHQAAASAADAFTELAQISPREIAASLTEAIGTFREAGEHLRSEFDETAQVVNTAFQANGRTIMEQVGARAVEINDSMRQVASDLIDAMENRGIESARLIEEKGGKIAEQISARSESLAERFLADGGALATRLEIDTAALVDSFGGRAEEFSARLIGEGGTLVTRLETNSDALVNRFGTSADALLTRLETNAGALVNDFTGRAEALTESLVSSGESLSTTLHAHAQELAQDVTARGAEFAEQILLRTEHLESGLAKATEILGETLEEKAALVETHISTGQERINALFTEGHGRLAANLEGIVDNIGTTLHSHTANLERHLVTHGNTLTDMIAARIEQTNTAFSIAGESMADLISERTKAAGQGLKSQIAELAESLTEQANDVTEKLAHSGRDVVDAIGMQGSRVNDALAKNAVRLAETVTERTAGLADRFDVFERSFLGKADKLEAVVTTQATQLTQTLDKRSTDISTSLSSLIERIETGLDNRSRSLADTLALRTLEISRSLGDSSKDLIATLEDKVEAFSVRVINPLGTHFADLDTKATESAKKISEHLESFDRRANESADALAARIERSADSLALRTGEIERALAALGNEVGSELMSKADDLARRITTSLSELDAAISSGSSASFERMAATGDKLRGEVSDLLARLAQTSSTLSSVVVGAQASLDEVEGKMAERVRGLEATLAAIMSASREGTDVLAAKVESIRNATGDVLGHSESVAKELEERTNSLKNLTVELASTQATVSRLLSERQQAFEGLTGTLGARIEDVDNMLRSFTGLVEEQLETAQTKAREAAVLVNETAEAATNAIGTQYERVRIESGKERERTSNSLRAAYDQANTEMSTLFQRTLEGFAATAAQFRQAAHEVQHDLESARKALASGGLEIPREAREASANLKRVVADQVRALNELSNIVSRSGPALDIAEPGGAAALRGLPPSAEPRANFRPAPDPVAPRIDTRTRPATSPNASRQGGTWLSGLLERAADDPAPRPRAQDASSAARIESLDSLSVDIARMIDHEAAVELWDRYRNGERNVFTRRLYTLQGQEAYDDIRRRYRRDPEFSRTVDAYIAQFEQLLAEIGPDDRDGTHAHSYLTSETGKVYTMLAHAAGRFD